MAALLIRKKIQEADALIAIATPRNLDQLTQTWKTLTWLHNEVGIAYGRDKPLLILQENTVELDALPEYLTTLNGVPRIMFTRNDVEKLLIDIDKYIPFFRHIIKNKVNDDFLRNLFANAGSAILGVAIFEISNELLNNNILGRDY
ncbi:MAG: hypothetical protein ACR2F1_10200 [Nitrososphaeraceae archaeon]